MPSIIIRRDGKPAKEVELEKGLTLIGQKADADINIEDPDQMEERASILKIGDDFILNELGAAEGTLVNGQHVKKHVLKDRDLITIGEYRMTFQDKRGDDKPVGIEMEIAEIRSEGDIESRLGKTAGPAKNTERVIYAVLGVIVVGIAIASYQSYVERQAVDTQTALINKANQETRRKEAEKFQGNASRAIESSIRNAKPPAETPVTELKQ